jgi:outer membrane protein assembly factor BamB
VQAGGDALVIAYDKMTGDIIWKSMQGDAGYAASTIMKNGDSEQLLIFHGKGLSCLNPDSGDELWTVEWKTNYGVNATTPVVYEDIVFITSGYNKGCQALKVNQGKIESLWINKIMASHHSDPVIIDGFVYGYSGQSNQNKGDFKCMDLLTGTEMWSTDEIGWGTTVFVDGYLLCMDIKGNLFLVEPNPDEFRLITEFRKALGQVDDFAWTIPVIANNKLYLRYMQRLICYDLVNK